MISSHSHSPCFVFLQQSSSSCCLKLTSCIHKALSLSLHSRLGVFGRARRSSGDPWSGRPRVRSYTISLSSSSSYISPSTKALSISIHSRLGVFRHARRSSWWSVEQTPPRAGAKVRSYPITLSLSLSLRRGGLKWSAHAFLLLRSCRGGGLKWNARLITFMFSSRWSSEVERARLLTFLVVVVVWSGARLVTLLLSFVSCSEALAGVLTLVFSVS